MLRDGYAGKVIESFGHFVVGGSLVIGLVIFLILIVIQFAVITNGAGRVAEVGARFTLDAMPGKQMAIDADLNSGLIDEHEARRRRAEVAAEADFYGAMDGGSKFVKGDAIAAIIITLINLIGGFAIGMLQRGMSPQRGAAHLQPADHRRRPGLPDPGPAAVRLDRSDRDPGHDPGRHGHRRRQPARPPSRGRCYVARRGRASGWRSSPACPSCPFLVVGVGAAADRPAGLAQAAKAEAAAPGSTPPPATGHGHARGRARPRSSVDVLEIVLAADLVDLVDAQRGGDLLDRVRALRRKVADELGLVMPPVRTRDSLDLPPSAYSVRISGVEVAQGRRRAGHVLAIGDDLAAPARHGHPRAGLRAGREVGAGRAAPAGRAATARPSSTARRS